MRYLIIFFLLSPSAWGKCIEAFEHPGFKGKKWEFSCGKSYRGFKRKISSIRVPKGYKATVCKGKVPCRTYFKDVSNVGSFLDNQISFVKGERFNSGDFSMIFASDPQLWWVCASDECKNKAQGEIGQGNLSNTWHVQSMNKLAASIGPNLAGAIFNGDLTAFGHKKEFEKYLEFYEHGTSINLWPGLGNHDYANNVDDCAFNNCAIRMVKYLINRVESLNVDGFDYLEGKTHFKFPNIRKEYLGSLAYSFSIGKYHFIQLNNYPSYEVSYNGWNFRKARRDYIKITKAFNWLKGDLEQARKSGKKIILNMHDTRQHFKKGDQSTFYNILKGYPVVAIFAGHVHQHFYHIYNEFSGTNKIPVFRSGAAQYNKYLRVNFKNNRMEVFTINSVNGKADAVKGPFVVNIQ
jgi:cytolysin (calcineurin-like family phosphatase)